MIMGCDQCLLPALTLGADGAIGSTYCFMPEIFVGIYDHYKAGEMEAAEKLMIQGFRVIYRLVHHYPGYDACREVMRLRGLETGRSRGPIPPLTPAQRRQLRRELEELDFFSDPIR